MPLLCRKLLALGGQMKDKLTERKRTGPAGIETGTRREDVGAAVTRAGEGGRGGSLENRGLESTGGRKKKIVRHFLKLKLGAISSSARREAVAMATAGQTGGLDYPERLRRVPLTPRFIPSPADLTLRPGPGSSRLSKIHLPVSQTEGKNVPLKFKSRQAPLHFGHVGSQI